MRANIYHRDGFFMNEVATAAFLPAGPVPIGDLYYVLDSTLVKRWDGAAWQDVAAATLLDFSVENSGSTFTTTFTAPAATQHRNIIFPNADGTVALNETVATTLNSNFVPYTGANAAVNLGAFTCTAAGFSGPLAGVASGNVSNVTDATLTRSGAGPYTLGLALGNANTWTGAQTFDILTSSDTLWPNANGYGPWELYTTVRDALDTTPTLELHLNAGTGNPGQNAWYLTLTSTAVYSQVPIYYVPSGNPWGFHAPTYKFLTEIDNAASSTFSSASTIVDDISTNAIMYPVWVTTTSGNLPLNVSSTGISFNPSTKILDTTAYSQTSANGAEWVHGQSSELVPLSNAALFTDSSTNLLPANSVIRAVTARVTTTLSGGTHAQGTITMSGTASVNETFVIAAQTFTWKALRGLAGEVTIGASATDAVTNIIAAVTTDLATVTAVGGAGTTVIITSVVGGAAGNALAFTEASTNMAVDGAGTLGATTLGVDTASWALGDSTVSTRFAAANTTLAAGATGVGLKHADSTGTAGPVQTGAAPVRITCVGIPDAGAIRLTVFYDQFIAPSS